MKMLRNKNAPPTADLVQHFIDTAYDNVKLVADNLTLVLEVAQAILDGTLGEYLSIADIDTLAELNAIVLDATLGDSADFATAAQGLLADSALQPEDIDTFAKLQSYVVDELIASQAYVDAAVAGLYDHKGSYDANTNTPDLDTAPSGIKKADAYTVSAAGTFFTAPVASGDVLIADKDDPTLETDWTIVNRNIDESAFATAAQGALADSALQPNDNISELNNDSGFYNTGSAVKTAYEAQADTNAFTDAEKTKLAGVEGGATADQSNAEIEGAYNAQVAAASQAEAEAGIEAGIRRFSPLRIAQAIAALGGGGGGGGGMTAVHTTINYTAAADELVYSDEGLTHNLPATPNSGDKVSFWDASDNAGTNAITIGRNGSTIFDAAEDFSLNMNGGRVDFMYNGTTWIYSYVVQTIQPTTVVTDTVRRFYRIGDTEIQAHQGASEVTKSHTYWYGTVLSLSGTAGWTNGFLHTVAPSNWDAGSVRCRFFFFVNGTTAGDVRLGNLIRAHEDGEDVDSAYSGGSVVYTSPQDADKMCVSDWFTCNLPGTPTDSSELAHFVYRDSAHVDDTCSNAVYLVGMQVEYTTEKSLTATVTNDPSAKIRTVAGTSDTILASDNGKEIVYTSNSAVAVTLPDGLPVEFNCVVSQAGTGAVTVTPATDTINGAATGVSPDAQWKGMYLAKYAATAWMAKF